MLLDIHAYLHNIHVQPPTRIVGMGGPWAKLAKHYYDIIIILILQLSVSL